MTTINKIQVYVLNLLQKQMLLTAFLLIAILVITYFKPETPKTIVDNTSIKLSVTDADPTTMPRFFLKN
jgi:hypothetical protein